MRSVEFSRLESHQIQVDGPLAIKPPERPPASSYPLVGGPGSPLGVIR